jgi:hypothetical protein
MSVASLRPQTQKSVGNRFYPLNSAQPTLSKNRPSRWLVLKWPALAGFEVATDNHGISPMDRDNQGIEFSTLHPMGV